MKKIFVICILLIILFPSVASAQTTNLRMQPPAKTTLKAKASDSAALNSVRTLANSKGRRAQVIAEIDRRIALLSESSKKVDSLTQITPTEKSTLLTKIQTATTNLQTLKSTVSANSDDASLPTDIQSLVSTHKDFSIVLPEARLLFAAELMDAIANKMLEVVKKIETRTATLEIGGTKTTAITPLILNLKAKLADVKAQSNAITAAVTPLSTSTTPNKSVLTAAQAKLKTGMQGLRSATVDLRAILKELKAIVPNTTTTGTESAN